MSWTQRSCSKKNFLFVAILTYLGLLVETTSTNHHLPSMTKFGNIQSLVEQDTHKMTPERRILVEENSKSTKDTGASSSKTDESKFRKTSYTIEEKVIGAHNYKKYNNMGTKEQGYHYKASPGPKSPSNSKARGKAAGASGVRIATHDHLEMTFLEWIIIFSMVCLLGGLILYALKFDRRAEYLDNQADRGVEMQVAFKEEPSQVEYLPNGDNPAFKIGSFPEEKTKQAKKYSKSVFQDEDCEETVLRDETEVDRGEE